MTRLSISIADTDEAYLQSFCASLVNNYSKRFRTCVFTNTEALKKSFDSTDSVVDILLISPEIFNEVLPLERINTLLVFSSSRQVLEIKNDGIINKYQHLDIIVKDIIWAYSQKNNNEIITTSGKRKAKIIGVYSPSGGVGKTSVAVCSAVCCAQSGLPVFYFNYESFNSSNSFISETSEQNLSKILYYLRENSKNLALKIEATKCIDPINKVHFFNSPESSLELDEMEVDEIVCLVETLRDLDQYEVIFIDMASSFNKNIIALMELCDQIVLIHTQESYCNAKLKLFFSELEILKLQTSTAILEKLKIILNKFNPEIPLKAI